MSVTFSEPIQFAPIYQKRVWGGRAFETLFQRTLPTGDPYGESWELVDREEAQSVVCAGAPEGLTLHTLWTEHRVAVFGVVTPSAPRFPLLAKLLHAKEVLSVQVHPPLSIAARLGSEPKTEMWVLLGTEPGAEVYAGFHRGTTRASFEQALVNGHAADTLHKIAVEPGDALFLPSGRCHAIGKGCIIAEIQQNSDTTYRVYDWDRVGLDGKPRELHITESLESIDFSDWEPTLQPREGSTVAECEHFLVTRHRLTTPLPFNDGRGRWITVTAGVTECGGKTFRFGDSFWIPACAAADLPVTASEEGAEILQTVLPTNPA
jgi:mannose-6-phosphate isomerase